MKLKTVFFEVLHFFKFPFVYGFKLKGYTCFLESVKCATISIKTVTIVSLIKLPKIYYLYQVGKKGDLGTKFTRKLRLRSNCKKDTFSDHP